MKLLLDTHSFLWFIEGNLNLSQKARTLIEADENEKLVSVASVFEIAIKSSLGKLVLSKPLEQIIPAQSVNHGISIVSKDEAFDAYGINRIW